MRIFVGQIRVGSVYEERRVFTDRSTNYSVLEGLWATVQMALSIICCCAITYRPLFIGSGGKLSRFFSKLPAFSAFGAASEDFSPHNPTVAPNDRVFYWKGSSG